MLKAKGIYMKRSYSELMEQSDRCMRIALEYRNKKDIDMVIFFRNASEDFKNKALEMVVEE